MCPSTALDLSTSCLCTLEHRRHAWRQRFASCMGRAHLECLATRPTLSVPSFDTLRAVQKQPISFSLTSPAARAADLAWSHLAWSHLADSHLADSHLADSHLAWSHQLLPHIPLCLQLLEVFAELPTTEMLIGLIVLADAWCMSVITLSGLRGGSEGSARGVHSGDSHTGRTVLSHRGKARNACHFRTLLAASAVCSHGGSRHAHQLSACCALYARVTRSAARLSYIRAR